MNRLCQLCNNGCKQIDAVKIIDCRRYRPAPVQLVLKFKSPKSGSGKKCKKK